MKKLGKLNVPFTEELSHEKLKTFKGFENINEAEAEKQILVIKKLARILFYLYQQDHLGDGNVRRIENDENDLSGEWMNNGTD